MVDSNNDCLNHFWVEIVLDKPDNCWHKLSRTHEFVSFNTCGISNALDGTEDDELYTEEGHEIDNHKNNEFNTDSKGESDTDAK